MRSLGRRGVTAACGTHQGTACCGSPRHLWRARQAKLWTRPHSASWLPPRSGCRSGREEEARRQALEEELQELEEVLGEEEFEEEKEEEKKSFFAVLVPQVLAALAGLPPQQVQSMVVGLHTGILMSLCEQQFIDCLEFFEWIASLGDARVLCWTTQGVTPTLCSCVTSRSSS